MEFAPSEGAGTQVHQLTLFPGWWQQLLVTAGPWGSRLHLHADKRGLAYSYKSFLKSISPAEPGSAHL